MKRIAAGLLLAIALLQQPALAGPEEDRKAFVAFYQSRFPDIPFQEFANGIYAIDADARQQWRDIEEFPPYEFAIDRGKALWAERFPNGTTYADCFAGPVTGIRQLFPRWDAHNQQVQTLELAINECRLGNDLAGLDYGSDELLSITAYLAFEARGQLVELTRPASSSITPSADSSTSPATTVTWCRSASTSGRTGWARASGIRHTFRSIVRSWAA
jgi:sulfur-oxidizing protein SoxA